MIVLGQDDCLFFPGSFLANCVHFKGKERDVVDGRDDVNGGTSYVCFGLSLGFL